MDNRLACLRAEKVRDTLVNVEAKTLVDMLADSVEKVVTETLGETLRDVEYR